VLFEPLSAEEFQGLGVTIERLVASGDRAIALLDYLAVGFERPETSESAALDSKTVQGSRI
jgi:hypothetical protein